MLDGVEVVATLEQDHRPGGTDAPGRVEHRARELAVRLVLEREPGQWIVAMGVETARHEHQLGPVPLEGRQGLPVNRARYAAGPVPAGNVMLTVAPAPAPTPRSCSPPVPGQSGL